MPAPGVAEPEIVLQSPKEDALLFGGSITFRSHQHMRLTKTTRPVYPRLVPIPSFYI
jgi:hypothetical protein